VSDKSKTKLRISIDEMSAEEKLEEIKWSFREFRTAQRLNGYLESRAKENLFATLESFFSK